MDRTTWCCLLVFTICLGACVERFSPQVDTVDPVDTSEAPDTNLPSDVWVEPEIDVPEDTVTPVDTVVAIDTQPPGDETAPEWAEGASLTVLDLGEDHLTLTWSPASDESGLTSYHVFQDGVLVTKLAPDNQSLQINQLQASQAYAYRIEAEDTYGNISASGPSLSVTTTDETLPVWDASSSISAGDVTAETLLLSWDGASDNVAVATYRIYREMVSQRTHVQSFLS